MKRPYSNHVWQAPSVPRSGTQPPTKRPATSRTPTGNTRAASHDLNIAATKPQHRVSTQSNTPSKSNGLGSFTEDQLDALFGDIDVDAVIAASGKSQALPSMSPAPTGPPAAPSNATSSQPNSSSFGTEQLKQGHEVASVPEPDPMRVSSGHAEGPANVCEGSSDGKKPLSAVDESMINNLLEGLDDSEFG